MNIIDFFIVAGLPYIIGLLPFAGAALLIISYLFSDIFPLNNNRPLMYT